ncbi:MAG: DUF2130 domain-containing protein [Patescibacteria group bacterium]|nr:DUF2130 domain-containing protein [Patescibacteria group bacterium]
MTDIICPNCGIKIEISQALKHEFEEKVRNEEKAKAKEEIEKVKIHTLAEAAKKFKDEAQKELTKAREEKEELAKKLEENKKDQEKNEKKIKEEAIKEVSQKSRLEKLEFEKKISDMQKALEEAQRKGKQGSQQLQGEVLELDLEQRLKTAFPNDEFLPVPKGVEGGDIWQKIKYKDRVVGSILWETKRTKAWSNSWIVKLKDDAAKISASEAIIVSQIMPEGMSNFDRKDGVWITTYEHAVGICRYVRFLITSMSSIKSSASQTEEEWGRIRDYMLSDSFKHRMQAHFDGIQALRTGFDAEKRATLLRWKKQEAQIEKLDVNTINFYGELKAIVSDLPEIKGVDSAAIDSGAENDEQETLI